MSLKSNGQMVRVVKVVTGQVTDGDARGTDQIQGVAFFMGWKIDVLGDGFPEVRLLVCSQKSQHEC